MVSSSSAQPAGGVLARRTELACPRVPWHSRYDYFPLTERTDYSWPGASGSLSASRPMSRYSLSARGAGAIVPGMASRRRSATIPGATLATGLAFLAAVRSCRGTGHAACPQCEQPALRARAADHGAHTAAGRRNRGARPRELGDFARFSLGGRRSARDSRRYRNLRAARRKTSQEMDGRRCLRESLDAGLAHRGGLRLYRGLPAR